MCILYPTKSPLNKKNKYAQIFKKSEWSSDMKKIQQKKCGKENSFQTF